MSEEKLEKQNIKAGISAIWRFAKPFKTQLWILAILGVVSAIANGAVPYKYKKFSVRRK